MMRFLFSKTARYALTGEQRFIYQMGAPPAAPDPTPGDPVPPAPKGLSDYLSQLDPLQKKALGESILKKIHTEGVIDATEIKELEQHAEAALDSLDEIKNMPRAEQKKLIESFPKNNDQMIDIAVRQGFLLPADIQRAVLNKIPDPKNTTAPGGYARLTTAPAGVDIMSNDPDELMAIIQDARASMRAMNAERVAINNANTRALGFSRSRGAAIARIRQEVAALNEKYGFPNAVFMQAKLLWERATGMNLTEFTREQIEMDRLESVARTPSRGGSQWEYEDTGLATPSNPFAEIERRANRRRINNSTPISRAVAALRAGDYEAPPEPINTQIYNPHLKVTRRDAEGNEYDATDSFWEHQPGMPSSREGRSSGTSSGRNRKRPVSRANMFGGGRVDEAKYNRTVKNSIPFDQNGENGNDALARRDLPELFEQAERAYGNLMRLGEAKVSQSINYAQLKLTMRQMRAAKGKGDVSEMVHLSKRIMDVTKQIENEVAVQNSMAEAANILPVEGKEAHIDVTTGVSERITIQDITTKKMYSFRPRYLLFPVEGKQDIATVKQMAKDGIIIELERNGNAIGYTDPSSNQNHISGIKVRVARENGKRKEMKSMLRITNFAGHTTELYNAYEKDVEIIKKPKAPGVAPDPDSLEDMAGEEKKEKDVPMKLRIPSNAPIPFMNEARKSTVENYQNTLLAKLESLGFSGETKKQMKTALSMEFGKIGDEYFMMYPDHAGAMVIKSILQDEKVTGLIEGYLVAKEEENKFLSDVLILKTPVNLLKAIDKMLEEQKQMKQLNISDPVALFNDPALESFRDIKEEWITITDADNPSGYPLDVWKLQMRMMIARNLYVTGTEIDKDSVEQEMVRILQAREGYKNVSVFKGKNVVHFAHSENVRDFRTAKGMPLSEAEYVKIETESGDTKRFGKDGVKNAIQKQQKNPDGTVNGSYERIRPEKNNAELLAAKQTILNRIKNTDGPATFIFDGHGLPDGFYLSDGQIGGLNAAGEATTVNTVSISAKELADAWKERIRNKHLTLTGDPNKKDIMVFSCCYNSDFIRNVYNHIGNGPKPIALGASEYGQASYSSPYSKFGSDTFENVLDLKDETKPTTINDVFLNEAKSSNPSLIIPDGSGLPVQITQTEQDEDMKV